MVITHTNNFVILLSVIISCPKFQFVVFKTFPEMIHVHFKSSAGCKQFFLCLLFAIWVNSLFNSMKIEFKRPMISFESAKIEKKNLFTHVSIKYKRTKTNIQHTVC